MNYCGELSLSSTKEVEDWSNCSNFACIELEKVKTREDKQLKALPDAEGSDRKGLESRIAILTAERERLERDAHSLSLAVDECQQERARLYPEFDHFEQEERLAEQHHEKDKLHRERVELKERREASLKELADIDLAINRILFAEEVVREQELREAKEKADIAWKERLHSSTRVEPIWAGSAING